MARTQELQDATNVVVRIRGSGTHAGAMYIIASGAPTNAQAGYGAGCFWVNSAGSAGAIFYVNIGSNTSTTWQNIA